MPDNSPKNIEMLAPATYQIKLLGQLDESWSVWFEGMVVSLEKDAAGRSISVLKGTLVDQPALYGLLSRIRDMGLLLLSVERLDSESSQ